MVCEFDLISIKERELYLGVVRVDENYRILCGMYWYWVLSFCFVGRYIDILSV